MQLNPYHIFEDQRGVCLINIERMTATRIDGATFRILDQLAADPNVDLSPGTAEHLQKLGLVADPHPVKKREGFAQAPAVSGMALLVTQRCNFKCIYCYADGGSYGDEGEMDLVTARRAVDWLIGQSQKLRKLSITFFGGEPLLNFSLIQDVVSYANQRSRETGKTFRFSLSTNASLLDDVKIAFIKAHHFTVNVGFDGLKAVQDAQRPFKDRKGSYDTTVPKIGRLLAAVPKAAARATLAGDCDPAGASRALHELGFSRVAVELASPSLLDGKHAQQAPEKAFSRMLEMAESEAEILLKHIRAKNTEILKGWAIDSYTILGKSLGGFIEPKKNFFFCGAGRRYAAVSSTGKIYLCHRFVGTEAYRIGNVFDGALKREPFQKSSLRFVQKCRGCFAKYFCSGGCYYDNLAANGSVFEPDEKRCRLARRSVELIAALTCRLSRNEKDYLIDEGIVLKKPCPFDF